MVYMKNLAIALINGTFCLVILLTTNLSRSSLLPVSFLITISTYGVTTMGDRLMPQKSIRPTKVYRIDADDHTLSD